MKNMRMPSWMTNIKGILMTNPWLFPVVSGILGFAVPKMFGAKGIMPWLTGAGSAFGGYAFTKSPLYQRFQARKQLPNNTRR
jgi:hypothetical protein